MKTEVQQKQSQTNIETNYFTAIYLTWYEKFEEKIMARTRFYASNTSWGWSHNIFLSARSTKILLETWNQAFWLVGFGVWVQKNDSKVFRLQGLLIWQCKLISLKWQHCFNGIQYKQTHDLSAERNAQKNNIKVVTSKPQKNNEHLPITTAYDKRNSDVCLWQINSNSRFFTFV